MPGHSQSEKVVELSALHVEGVSRANAELELVFRATETHNWAISSIAHQALPLGKAAHRKAIIQIVACCSVQAERMDTAGSMEGRKAGAHGFGRVH